MIFPEEQIIHFHIKRNLHHSSKKSFVNASESIQFNNKHKSLNIVDFTKHDGKL